MQFVTNFKFIFNTIALKRDANPFLFFFNCNFEWLRLILSGCRTIMIFNRFWFSVLANYVLVFEEALEFRIAVISCISFHRVRNSLLKKIKKSVFEE